MAGLALVIAACSPSAVPDPIADGPDPTAEPQGGSQLPGRLLVLGDEYEIVIMNPDGSGALELAGPAGGLLERQNPAWSNDGSQVAWTEGVVGELAELVIATVDGRRSRRVPIEFPASYLAWSPDDGTIAALGNDVDGELRLTAVGVEAGDPVDIERGAPMYFDWAPDSSGLLVHVEDRFEFVSLDGRRLEVETDGDFRVGAYVGDSIIYAMDAGIGEALVVAEDLRERPVGVMRFAAPAAFVAHPSGEKLALLARGARESQAVVDFDDPILATLAPERLEIFDLATGRLETVATSQVVAWFWSPDGRRLLYSRTATVDGEVKLQWWIYENGQSTTAAAFVPFGDYAREYLAFFDQFARTTSFWSPDSNAFTYAGGDREVSGIWVQSVGHPEPMLVAQGRVAVWSPSP